MIDAKQLRIGNWIYDNNGTPDQVSADWFAAYNMNFETATENTGILLTPEILQKCGFESDNIGWRLKISEFMFLWWGELEHIVRLCSSDNIYSYPIHLKDPVCHFQFLHQLQNLYFALTGTELQIKLS